MTVQTQWSGLMVTDWLDGVAPANALVRMLSGSVPVQIEFAPRPEFGQVAAQLHQVGDELRVFGSNEPMALVAPGVEWTIADDAGHHTARAIVDLAARGGSLVLELRIGDGVPPDTPAPTTDQALQRQNAAEKSWREWAGQLRLPRYAREHVLRSALTLRALRYEPTLAIIAAGTTSLPEEMGGVRNWDYRYCWLRDAAMSAHALVSLGSGEEAEGLLLLDPGDHRAGTERAPGTAAPTLHSGRFRARR